MSRIAGVVDDPETPRREQACLQGCAAMAAAGWNQRVVSKERASLASCAWRRPGLADCQGLLLAWDGCIYNRDQLEGLGDDATVAAGLVRRHGFAQALTMINGDFAVAAYDTLSGELYLGRDRFGVKPLYHADLGGGLGFASRPAGLLAMPGVSRQVNPGFVGLYAASHYRVFDNDPQASPYRHIRQLPAAHYLRWARGVWEIRPYWQLRDQGDWDGDEEDLAGQYRDLLADAVGRRLARAGRPAFLLSGGMDSSSVLALAVRGSGVRQAAYSSVYSDKTFDESAEIQPMLTPCVERWNPVAVEPQDVFKHLEEIIAWHDEPVATATWLSHYLCCRQASQDGFDALFGGLGGDELNAGEYEYFFFHFADLHWRGEHERLAREVDCWARHHDHPLYRKNTQVAQEAILRMSSPQPPGRCLPDLLRLRRYLEALEPDFFDLASFNPIMEHPFPSHLKNRAYQDLTRETTPCCLRAEDRQATAWGLDHFLPFLDHRLVEFMFRMPGGLKIKDGVTKHLLRLAMRGVLPEETRTRVKKTGWNAPAHLWFTGQGRDFLLDLTHSQAFRQRGIYRLDQVDKIIAEHQEIVADPRPRENHMMFLWQLTNLELWLRQLAR